MKLCQCSFCITTKGKMNVMPHNATDMDQWIKENKDRLFRFLRYRKVFTPYEVKEAFMDESEFEDEGYYQYGFIREAISLGAGDWLLGFQPAIMESGEVKDTIEYARLSDIRLSYNSNDIHKLYDDGSEDEDFE